MSIYHRFDAGVPSEIHVYGHGPRCSDPPPGARTPQAGPPVQAANDAARRRRAQPSDEPFAATFRWVASFPKDLRPLALLRQFPRIANVLALSAGNPETTRDYLFELLVDRRGDRLGFPEEVRAELLRLRAYVDEGSLQSGLGASGVRRA